MIRPFDLRDIGLVRQLERHGTQLDTRLALTGSQRPLRQALLAYLMAGRGAPTWVMRERDAGVDVVAFGQMRLCPNRPQARLVALASRPEDQESKVWPQMLEALTQQAGHYGAHLILAHAADGSSNLELLRQADFVVYTRQEIWQQTAPLAPVQERWLRPENEADRWHIQQLVANTVPRLIQQIEGKEEDCAGLVWKKGDDLLAYVSAHCGSRGVWLQFYLHPQAEESAQAIIHQAAAMLSAENRPLYCCVRRYQEWLSHSLRELSFEPLGCQAVMVRHTTVRLPQPAPGLVPVREKGLEVTPVAHSQARHDA